MGKGKGNQKQTLHNFKPFVSVCTPTFNRRPFIPIMLDCFRNQTYPKHRIEWIIVDDGTDKIKDLIENAGIANIRYFALDTKMPLGEKRNFMHKKVKGSIVVYMDDDDYYPPERIEHAVEKLQGNKEALCAGSSEMYIYFKHIHQMYQCGPYGPNHATAGTFAFKVRLLDDTRYEDHAALAEERAFLKGYTIPFVQLDPLKTILVFSHNHNTFDKKRLLENPHPQYFKPSERTVDEFIATPEEQHIKRFFLDDIDELLEKYEPGEPKMKPDVLEQTKKIEENRRKMQQQQNPQPSSIMINEPGKESRQLSSEETVSLLQRQQEDLKMLVERNKELENIIVELQMQIMKNSKNSNDIIRPDISIPSEAVDISNALLKVHSSTKLKSEPEILI
jgi:glycosyltransferase involved in cell wall biosynthesis